jgi:hypothetical protein
MLRHVALRCVRRLLVTANVPSSTDSCYPDDGGAKLLRNVGSYKRRGVTSHKTTFFIVTTVNISNLT